MNVTERMYARMWPGPAVAGAPERRGPRRGAEHWYWCGRATPHPVRSRPHNGCVGCKPCGTAHVETRWSTVYRYGMDLGWELVD